MKSFLRGILINITALWGASQILPGLTYRGGFRTLLVGGIGLLLINMLVVPLLKVAFLPLNLLTLGIFTWVINVIALYLFTLIIPNIKILPYYFPGLEFSQLLGIGAIFTIPPIEFNVLTVAILASFLVGLISHFLKWLTTK